MGKDRLRNGPTHPEEPEGDQGMGVDLAAPQGWRTEPEGEGKAPWVELAEQELVLRPEGPWLDHRGMGL